MDWLGFLLNLEHLRGIFGLAPYNKKTATLPGVDPDTFKDFLLDHRQLEYCDGYIPLKEGGKDYWDQVAMRITRVILHDGTKSVAFEPATEEIQDKFHEEEDFFDCDPY